jgi:hypothetical protein
MRPPYLIEHTLADNARHEYSFEVSARSGIRYSFVHEEFMITHPDSLNWEGPRYSIQVTTGVQLEGRLQRFTAENDPVMVREMNWLGFHLRGVFIPQLRRDVRDFSWSVVWDPGRGVDVLGKGSNDQPQIFRRNTPVPESERDHFMITLIQGSMRRNVNYWNRRLASLGFIEIPLPVQV